MYIYICIGLYPLDTLYPAFGRGRSVSGVSTWSSAFGREGCVSGMAYTYIAYRLCRVYSRYIAHSVSRDNLGIYIFIHIHMLIIRRPAFGRGLHMVGVWIYSLGICVMRGKTYRLVNNLHIIHISL